MSDEKSCNFSTKEERVKRQICNGLKRIEIEELKPIFFVTPEK
jgi:hypothetical protein